VSHMSYEYERRRKGRTENSESEKLMVLAVESCDKLSKVSSTISQRSEQCPWERYKMNEGKEGEVSEKMTSNGVGNVILRGLVYIWYSFWF
jgi:hypothetical protein